MNTKTVHQIRAGIKAAKQDFAGTVYVPYRQTKLSTKAWRRTMGHLISPTAYGSRAEAFGRTQELIKYAK